MAGPYRLQVKLTLIVLSWMFKLNKAKPPQISWGIQPLHHLALTDKVMSLVTEVSQLILCRVRSGQLFRSTPPLTFGCCLEMTILVERKTCEYLISLKTKCQARLSSSGSCQMRVSWGESQEGQSQVRSSLKNSTVLVLYHPPPPQHKLFSWLLG